jgi:superfamily II DNA or RNA helicase
VILLRGKGSYRVSDLILHKKNEAFIQFECERSIAQELSEYFTFFVPGYQFTPAYKSKVWDGKIRLADLRTFTIYHGLVHYIQKFCAEREYSLEIDDDVIVTENFSLIEAVDFIRTLELPFEPRDYQIKSFVNAIRNKRILLLSPTASGKSLILYLIIRYMQHMNPDARGLLIVPTTSLVEQMYKDFEDYGYDSEEYCHRQYAGKEKHTNKFLTITTWQSIYKNEKEYFEQFDFVLGDEAHQFKAKSLTTILSGCSEAKYRIGTTGTLDGTQTHRLVLEGLFGPVYKATTTSELIEKGQLADFKIKCLVLKYPENICKQSRDWDYNTEMDYIVQNKARNDFIRNLTLSLEGNSLILFQFVEKHGKDLYQNIKSKAGNRHVFFVFGGTDVEVRESVRSITEKEKDAIIVASYGTFSTGINIRNLHNIVFASPSKSRVRNLQSIGRGLRKGDNKEQAVLFDIADDFRIGKHANYTLKHFIERVKIYDEEKFNYKFYNIELKDGNND